MNLRKVNPAKTRRFFLFIFLILLGITAASYVLFPLRQVLGRNVESVVNTEWVSWDNGSLLFHEETVEHVGKENTTTHSFEEEHGAIEILDDGQIYMILSRFGENKLMTSDGKAVFYLKTLKETSEKSTKEDSHEESN